MIDDTTFRLFRQETGNLDPSYRRVLDEIGPTYQAATQGFPDGPRPIVTRRVDPKTLTISQDERPESALEYRGRLLKTIQQRTDTYPHHDFVSMVARDGAAAVRLERDILKEAPRKIPEPREVRFADPAGRVISEFIGGNPKQWMAPYTSPGKRAVRWRDG